MDSKKKFTLIPDYGDINNPTIRAKYGYLEASVSIIVNTLLFLLKIFLGLFINSIALIADGVHSLSDVSTSGVVIFGFRIAKKQPDKEHPYGHARAEYIATLIIAILLIIVGFGFIEQSIQRIINLEKIEHGEYAFIISILVIISAIIKELMARYSSAISKKINSNVLKADAWHHRSDAISSIGVAIGILGARNGLPILDPIFGIVVSIIIIYVGVNLVKNASNFLIGQAPEKDLIDKIKKIADTEKTVNDIHSINIHDYGTTKIITLHAEVNSNLTVEESHEIADSLQNKIKFITNYSTIIHIEPDKSCLDKYNKKKLIEDILLKQKEVISFHKIQIICQKDKDYITMHLIVNKKLSLERLHKFSHKLEDIIKKEYGSSDVNIHFDPCIDNCKKCNLSCKNKYKKIVNNI